MSSYSECEIQILTNFILERLDELVPQPKIFGKKRWLKSRNQTREKIFLALHQNTFHSVIWQLFECDDHLFLGENGMRELAEHTTREDGVWVYHKPRTNVYRAVYPSNRILVPMSTKTE